MIKVENMPVVGTRGPSNQEYIHKQVAMAHEYRNARVRARIEYEGAVEKVLRRASPELDKIIEGVCNWTTEKEAIYANIRQANQAAKRRVPLADEVTQRLAELKSTIYEANKRRWDLVAVLQKPAWAAIDAAKKTIKMQYQAQEELDAKAAGRASGKKKLKSGDDCRRELEGDAVVQDLANLEWELSNRLNRLNREYSDKGLNPGTRWRVDQALKPKRGVPAASVLREFSGNGVITVIVRPKTWEDIVVGRCNAVQVRQEGKFAVFTIVTAARPVRQEFEAKVELDIHNPRWRTDSKIPVISLSQHKVGRQYHYQLQVTADFPDDMYPVPDEGIVGLDLGWRWVKDGLRVATVTGVSGDGEVVQEQLVISTSQLDKLIASREVRSARDVAADNIRLYIRSTDNTPANVANLATPQSRAIVALREAVAGWDDCPEHILRWAHTDEWWGESKQAHLLRKFGNQRQAMYRKFARYLADRYRFVVVEDMDLRRMARKSDPEVAEKDQIIQNLRTMAATSSLRQAILGAFGPARSIVQDAAYTSQDCLACGHRQPSGPEQFRTCDACDTTIDQDAMASTLLVMSAARDKQDELTIKSLDMFRTSSTVQTWDWGFWSQATSRKTLEPAKS